MVELINQRPIFEPNYSDWSIGQLASELNDCQSISFPKSYIQTIDHYT